MGPRGRAGLWAPDRGGHGQLTCVYCQLQHARGAGGPKTSVCLMLMQQAFFEHTLWASRVLWVKSTKMPKTQFLNQGIQPQS